MADLRKPAQEAARRERFALAIMAAFLTRRDATPAALARQTVKFVDALIEALDAAAVQPGGESNGE